jgi:putative Mg2+ transporter-C (MgtC) family protein
VDAAGWPVQVQIGVKMVAALVDGSLIGLERTFHGRAAGFRTFALVALGSCLPMTAATHPALWLPQGATGLVDIDPTRVMRGIVTGIGFLGAGVIFRDGFSVRGLTTAACVWVVSSIGMLIGVGLLAVAGAATAATLLVLVLALFRRIEGRLPGQVYAYVTVRYRRAQAPAEVDTGRPLQVGELVERLRDDPNVTQFRVASTRDCASGGHGGCIQD